MGVNVREWPKGSGKWYVVVHYAGRRKSLLAESEEDAHSLAKKFYMRLELEGLDAFNRMSRLNRADGTPTVKQFSKRWLKELGKSELKPSTINRYETNVRIHLVPEFGRLRLDAVTYSLVKDFVIEKAHSGLSRDTVRLMVATLRSMLNEAIEEGIIAENPCRRLGKFYGVAPTLKDQPNPFTWDEVVAIESAALGRFPSYYEVVSTLARTGMRIGECLALWWSDINFSRGTIQIQRNFPSNPSVKQMSVPKTKASRRTVDVNQYLLAVLRGLRSKTRKKTLKKGWDDIPKWVFSTSNRTPIQYSNFRKAWVRMQQVGDVRFRHPHNLRHTFASRLLSLGAPLLYVSQQLGHRSPDITLKVYARWIPDEGSKRWVELLDSAASGGLEWKGKEGPLA